MAKKRARVRFQQSSWNYPPFDGMYVDYEPGVPARVPVRLGQSSWGYEPYNNLYVDVPAEGGRARVIVPGSWRSILPFSGMHVEGLSGIPLGITTWESGIYLDFPLLGFGGGATLTSAVVPQVGTVDPLPVNSPVVDGVGILGNDAPFLDQAAAQYFSAHALASLVFGSDKPCSIVIHCKRDYPAGDRSAFGFGNSTQSTNDFYRGTFPGGVANSPTLVKDAVGEATKSVTRLTSMDYDDHVVAFVNNGTIGAIYLDGVPVASGDLDTLAITPNRFVIGAHVTTAVLSFLGGWLARFAMTDRVLSPSEVLTVYQAWTSVDLGTPGKPGGAPFQFFGDSITQGDSDNDPSINNNTRGGFRYNLYEWMRQERLRVRMVGQNIQGIFANPQHSATGGFNTAQIAAAITAHIPTYLPRGMFVMAGTNNAVAVESGGASALATWRAQYDTMLNNARTQLGAYQSDGQVVVANLTPIQPLPGNGSSAIPSMNAEILLAIAANDAAWSGAPPIIFCNFHDAIAPWDLARFKDAAHPNHPGYALLGNELIAKAGPYFMSIAA